MMTKTRNTKKPKIPQGSSTYSVGNMFVGWLGLAIKILMSGYDASSGWV